MVRNTGRTLTCNVPVAASLATPQTVQCNNTNRSKHDSSIRNFRANNRKLGNHRLLYPSSFGAATGTTDPMIEFIKDRGVSMGITTPLSALLISNNTRPRFLPTPIGYEAGSILTIQAITTTR